MQYTNQAKVEAEIKRPLTTDEETNFDELVENISEFISNTCNRVWRDIDSTGEEDADTIRLYDGEGKQELFINDIDIESITKIELLDSEGSVFETIDDVDDFILYPLNATAKNSIVLRNMRFPLGYAKVKLTGVFTSGDVPKSIIMAATKLVTDYLSTNQENGPFSSENIEGYSYKLKTGSEINDYQQNILNSINHYKKVVF